MSNVHYKPTNGDLHIGFLHFYYCRISLKFKIFLALLVYLQKREDYAVYCDAYIVDIERRMNDLTGCRCTFFVRYDHDNSQVISMIFLCAKSIPSYVISLVLLCYWIPLTLDLLDLVSFALYQEGVHWDRLCCRPAQEEPIITLNPIEDLWGWAKFPPSISPFRNNVEV